MKQTDIELNNTNDIHKKIEDIKITVLEHIALLTFAIHDLRENAERSIKKVEGAANG